MYVNALEWRPETVAMTICPVQTDTELGAPGKEYNKSSPWSEGRPRLLKGKTHHPTTPSGILAKINSFSTANHTLGPFVPVVRRLDNAKYKNKLLYIG